MKHIRYSILACVILLSVMLVCPASAAYSTLRKGSSGNQVCNMQSALSSLGYRITVDGKYGNSTMSVVKQFQKDHGLTVDGVAGNKTLSCLYSILGTGDSPVQTDTTPAPVTDDSRLANVRTSGGSLNLRSAPSSKSAVLRTIPNGATVTCLLTDGDWYYITYNGSWGYVSSSYIVFVSVVSTPTVPSATPTPSPVSPTTVTARVTTSGSSLNLRAAETTSSRIVASIPNQSVITVLSQGKSWSKVSWNSKTGYVSNAYITVIQPQNTPSSTPVPAATDAPSGQIASAVGTAHVNTNGNTLNLRSAPSFTASVTSQLPNQSELIVYSYDTSWAYISYNGKFGYVSSPYIVYTPYTYSDPELVEPTPVPESGYDTSIFTRTLRSGYTGTDVTLLQKRLCDLNYLSSSQLSGKYDDTTVSAVKKFQTLHGLTADGLAGKATFSQLFSSSAIAYSSGLSGLSTLHIYYRNEGSQDTDAITRMQNALLSLGYPVQVNGSFEEKTYMAVLEFQLRNDLPVTGAATVQTLSVLYSSSARPYSAAPSVTVSENEGRIAGPSASEVHLLHWFNIVKPSLSSGNTLQIFDPATHLSWNLIVMSMGNHCDSQPASLKDTLIMNKAFGTPSWTVHTVYVHLPDGRWTMATMHNRPHLTGSITENGFDGHLCVHFLRDLDEVKKNDPDYGLSNQLTLRSSWKNLTGIDVN